MNTEDSMQNRNKLLKVMGDLSKTIFIDSIVNALPEMTEKEICLELGQLEEAGFIGRRITEEGLKIELLDKAYEWIKRNVNPQETEEEWRVAINIESFFFGITMQDKIDRKWCDFMNKHIKECFDKYVPTTDEKE